MPEHYKKETAEQKEKFAALCLRDNLLSMVKTFGGYIAVYDLGRGATVSLVQPMRRGQFADWASEILERLDAGKEVGGGDGVYYSLADDALASKVGFRGQHKAQSVKVSA